MDGLTCGLARITLLSLPGNNLLGTIPASTFAAWPNLTIANLADNELSGTLSSQLGGLHSLHELTLQHNLLSGILPTELGTVGRLGLNTYTGSGTTVLGLGTTLM